MRRNLFFSLFLILGLGLVLSSCTPGIYAGASVGGPGYGYGYGNPYGGGYYGSRYYAPRPVIVQPIYRGGWHGGGERGSYGVRGGGYGGHSGGYGGRHGR